MNHHLNGKDSIALTLQAQNGLAPSVKSVLTVDSSNFAYQFYLWIPKTNKEFLQRGKLLFCSYYFIQINYYSANSPYFHIKQLHTNINEQTIWIPLSTNLSGFKAPTSYHVFITPAFMLKTIKTHIMTIYICKEQRIIKSLLFIIYFSFISNL